MPMPCVICGELTSFRIRPRYRRRVLRILAFILISSSPVCMTGRGTCLKAWVEQ